MKIYVKDIMPEEPIFWAELGMPLKYVLGVMIDRSFTLLPARNAAKELVGTITQRSILRLLGESDSLNVDQPFAPTVLEQPLKIVEPFAFLDAVDDDLRRD